MNGFSWHEKDGVRVLVPDFFANLQLSGGFSTRSTLEGRDLDFDLRGTKDLAAILENRRLVCGAMGVDAQALILGEQVHGAAVGIAEAADAGKGAFEPEEAARGVDALVTSDPQVPLAVLSADCVMVLLADSQRRAISAVHSGWRGTLEGVVSEAVRTFGELDVRPDALFAAIGPAIRQSSYEVSEDVRERFSKRFTWGAEIFTISSGRCLCDLPGAVSRQLADAGVAEERIFDCGLSTFTEDGLFYSYRRDTDAAGRIAGVISIDG